MFKHYKRAFTYLKENPVVLFFALLTSLIASPLKWNRMTGLVAYTLILIFIGGFLGLQKHNKKLKRKTFKVFFLGGIRYFSMIVMNLTESFLIAVINFIVVGFFGILPMIVLGVVPNEEMSKVLLGIMLLMVFLYRLPLFVMSFITPMSIEGDCGRFAIAKIKEIVWSKPSLWLSLILQSILYILLLVFSFTNNLDDNLIIFTIIDVIRAFIFLFFITANFYYYEDIIKGNKNWQEKYDRTSYTGRFKGISGRLIM